MALDLTKKETKPMGYEVTERLYVNAARDKIVPEDSPEAAFVLATPGKVLPDDEAERLGLTKSSKKPADKQADAPEDKSSEPEPQKAAKRATRKAAG